MIISTARGVFNGTAVLVVALFVLLSSAAADSLWREGTPSLFSDRRAYRVGDILTVLIVENAKAKKEATTRTANDFSSQISGGPGTGPLDFIPDFSVNGSTKNDYDGSGSTERSGSFTATIAALVTEVIPGGNLRIQGQREVMVNGEREIINLSGIVRPQDIKTNNTVLSTVIAEASISYQGKGAVNTSQSPGLVARLINWLF